MVSLHMRRSDDEDLMIEYLSVWEVVRKVAVREGITMFQKK